MIVHLAGAPGSGKTTIAKQVEKRDWIVYDLDDLNIAFVEGNSLIPLTRTDPQRVVAMYQQHINEIVEQSRINRTSILFVGINAGLLGSPPGSNIIHLQSDHNVLLDVDTALNAKRWIQRDMPEVLDEFVKSLKDDVSTYKKLEQEETKTVKQYNKWFREIMRDFRPSQRKDDIYRFKKYFVKKGYVPMSPSQFVEWFSLL